MGIDTISVKSPIHEHYQGMVWDVKMYNILGRPKITLNYHSKVAKNYANNMRLFKATSMGAYLVTGNNDNLADIFIPGKEVVAYDNINNCMKLIKYYLDHNESRRDVALAGQQRAINSHNYYGRMRELLGIFTSYLN